MAYLGDFGVRTAAVPGGGVHPCALWGSALLSQGALLVPYAPAALKPGVCLQTHPAAVPQSITLVQVSWRQEKEKHYDIKEKTLVSSLSLFSKPLDNSTENCFLLFYISLVMEQLQRNPVQITGC